jgi:zinc transport system substrate-binding protein
MEYPTRSRALCSVVFALSLALGLAGCSPSGSPGGGPPRVVVSVLPQKFFIDRLAGDEVRVEVMIPPGASPAVYEPTLAQRLALEGAALYVKVGHPAFAFERAWLDELLADRPGLPVVDCAAGLEPGRGDPHVWVAPRLGLQMATRIEAALEELLPEHRPALQERLAAFRTEIEALDAELKATLAGSKDRSFFVYHPAWGYFADAYGLRQVAVEHEHRQPDARELAALIELAKQSRPPVIFVQPQFDSTAAKTLALEIGARVEPLDPLAYDWAANLRRVAQAVALGAVP